MSLSVVNIVIKKPPLPKPKRGRSSYIFFCADMRPVAKLQLGNGAKSNEIASFLGKMWKEFKNDKEKMTKYNLAAAEDLLRYQKEFKMYNQQNIDLFDVELFGPRPVQKRSKTAYQFFCIKNRAEAKKTLGKEVKAIDITAHLRKNWLTISNDEIIEYKKLADEDKIVQAKESLKPDMRIFNYIKHYLSDGIFPPFEFIESFAFTLLWQVNVFEDKKKFADDLRAASGNEQLILQTLISVSKYITEKELLIIFRSSLIKSKGECVVCYNEGDVFEWPCHKSHIVCEDCTIAITTCTSLCPLCRFQMKNNSSYYLKELQMLSEKFLRVSESQILTLEDMRVFQENAFEDAESMDRFIAIYLSEFSVDELRISRISNAHSEQIFTAERMDRVYRLSLAII